MKVYNHLYHDKRRLEIFLNGIELDRNKQMLVRIHSSVHSAKEMSSLAKEIKEFLPNSSIIGCSTSGVICDGKIVEDACLVSIATFNRCCIETLYTSQTENEKGLCAELSEKLIKKRKGFMLLFLPAFYAKGIKLVNISTNGSPE